MRKPRSQRPLVKTYLLLSAATFPLLAATFVPAHAQEATDQPFDLGTIVLRGDVGEGDGFKAEQTSTGTRINSPLDELPLSVDVITPDLIEATNAGRVKDVVTTTTGASIGNEFGGLQNAFLLRGFNADVADNGNLSGFMDVQQRDSVDVERIEVLSGPASALFGFGPPGGIINVTTKTPQNERFLRFKSEISSSASVRQEIDFNTPLTEDGRIKARFVGAIEGTNSFRFSDSSSETLPEHRVVLSPSLSIEPNEKLSILLRAQYLRDNRVFDRGIGIGLDGEPVSDIDDFLGDIQFDNFILENTTVNAEATYRFNDDWSITGVISGNRSTRDGFAVEPEAFFENAGAISPQLGFLAPNPNSVLRQLEFRNQDTTRISGRVDLNGAFSTGSVDHEIAFSVAAFDSENDSFITQSGFIPPSGETITLDDLGQSTSTTLGAGDFTIFNDSLTEVETISVSFFDKLSFGENVHFLAGGRLDILDQTVTTLTEVNEISETQFSPRLGLVVKPLQDKGFSAFVSYGESFDPNLILAVGGGFLAPREGRTFEGGVAYTFNNDRLTASFTAFDIEEDNVPLSFDGTFAVPSTNTSQGIELSLKGALNDNWGVSASYTYLDTEIGGVNGTTVDVAAGETIIGVPDHTLALLSTYRFDNGSRFDGLTLTGAVRYQSSRLLQNSVTTLGIDLPAIELDPTVRVDLSGTYELNERVRLQAGLQNIFDEEIIRPSAGFGIGSPEAGRTVFASASFEF